MMRRIKRHRFRSATSIYQQFKNAIDDNEISKVKELLNNSEIDPQYERSWSIRYAVSWGHYGIVKLLLEDGRANPAEFINVCVKTAAEHGHSRILRLLLKDERVNPACDNSYALSLAAEHGKLTCFKLLYNDNRTELFDKERKQYESLSLASANGHTKIVEILLKNKKIRYSKHVEQAFRDANEQKHYKTAYQFFYGNIKKMIKEDNFDVFGDFKIYLQMEKINNF